MRPRACGQARVLTFMLSAGSQVAITLLVMFTVIMLQVGVRCWERVRGSGGEGAERGVGCGVPGGGLGQGVLWQPAVGAASAWEVVYAGWGSHCTPEQLTNTSTCGAE
jgi:hypothetical protein